MLGYTSYCQCSLTHNKRKESESGHVDLYLCVTAGRNHKVVLSTFTLTPHRLLGNKLLIYTVSESEALMTYCVSICMGM